MAGVFISYRRDDTAGHAGRLFDALVRRFGEPAVFMDLTDIAPGSDFVETIDRAVGSCDVLLVLIGRNWSTSADDQGRARLEDPQDFIRHEVATALEGTSRWCRCSCKAHGCPRPISFRTISRRSRAARLSS